MSRRQQMRDHFALVVIVASEVSGIPIDELTERIDARLGELATELDANG